MIVDSSALLSVLLDEAPGKTVLGLLEAAYPVFIPSVVLVECALRLMRLPDREEQIATLGKLPQTIGATVEPFLPEDAAPAIEAYRRFGKGQGHPAQLNFGDCMVYATARRIGLPLLCLGRDFAATDLALVPVGADG